MRNTDKNNNNNNNKMALTINDSRSFDFLWLDGNATQNKNAASLHRQVNKFNLFTT